jgi:hypothetical protein
VIHSDFRAWRDSGRGSPQRPQQPAAGPADDRPDRPAIPSPDTCDRQVQFCDVIHAAFSTGSDIRLPVFHALFPKVPSLAFGVFCGSNLPSQSAQGAASWRDDPEARPFEHMVVGARFLSRRRQNLRGARVALTVYQLVDEATPMPGTAGDRQDVLGCF